MKINRSALVYPAVVLLLALACSVVIYFVRSAKYETWESAPAVITAQEDLRGHKTKLHYSYSVDGVIYRGSDVMSDSATSLTAGSDTEVWYDAAQPEVSMLTPPTAWFDALAPWFLALPLGIAVYAYNSRPEQQRTL